MQYTMNELIYNAKAPAESSVTVDLKAEFIAPSGKMITVKGFYCGNDTYKIRFYPIEPGTYKYSVSGIITDSGEIECVSNDSVSKEGSYKSHGMVRPAGNHFRYDDGTWFYPFGTTVYALIHQEKKLIEQTLATLKGAPFNKVRMCVFPKDYDYNKNEPELYAYEKDDNGKWDYNRPCYEFYEHLESVITELNSYGIQCDLILFHPYDRWGFSKMNMEEADLYIDYITRRLSAYPNVWWSLANEFDILDYSRCEWEHIAAKVHECDPFGHLLSNHNCIEFWDFDNKDTTHICLQIKSVDDINHMIDRYNKPLMVDECCYEGTIMLEWGNISGFEMVNKFWKCITQGGYCTHGETYLCDDDILWWSKGGILKGESPARIEFLKNIVEELPGPLTYCGDEFTREKYEALKEDPEKCDNEFWRAVIKADWERAREALTNGKEFMGCYEDLAYLRYYERKCPGKGIFDLPEDKKYIIEVIDVWNMTRQIAENGASGHVEVVLPGKEGIALLARKI